SGVAQTTPRVPAIDLDPRVHTLAVTRVVRLARVVASDPVDVLQGRIVGEVDDPSLEAHVRDPVLRIHRRQAHPRIVPQVFEALTGGVHVDEDPAVLEEMPGRNGHRLTVGAQWAGRGVVGLGAELGNGLGYGSFRHGTPFRCGGQGLDIETRP